MQIRILVRLCCHKKLGFDMENIPYVGSVKRSMLYIRFICYFWSFPFLLDPNPQSLYGSGSWGAQSMRIRMIFKMVYNYYTWCLFSMIKTEVDPWQLLETDLVEEDDPLVLDR
jgi:hypothetical protein